MGAGHPVGGCSGGRDSTGDMTLFLPWAQPQALLCITKSFIPPMICHPLKDPEWVKCPDFTRLRHPSAELTPQSTVLTPQSRILIPQSRILTPQSTILAPQGRILAPQSTILTPQGRILTPQSTVLTEQDSAGQWPLGMTLPKWWHNSPEVSPSKHSP